MLSAIIAMVTASFYLEFDEGVLLVDALRTIAFGNPLLLKLRHATVGYTCLAGPLLCLAVLREPAALPSAGFVLCSAVLLHMLSVLRKYGRLAPGVRSSLRALELIGLVGAAVILPVGIVLAVWLWKRANTHMSELGWACVGA
jgi:hypothetical protein